MVPNTPYTQNYGFQKGQSLLLEPAAPGPVSEKKPHQQASLSAVYLIPKHSFKQNCHGSESSFLHMEWEAQEQVLGRCSKEVGKG